MLRKSPSRLDPKWEPVFRDKESCTSLASTHTGDIMDLTGSPALSPAPLDACAGARARDFIEEFPLTYGLAGDRQASEQMVRSAGIVSMLATTGRYQQSTWDLEGHRSTQQPIGWYCLSQGRCTLRAIIECKDRLCSYSPEGPVSLLNPHLSCRALFTNRLDARARRRSSARKTTCKFSRRSHPGGASPVRGTLEN
jgi:hypothetical protein